MASASADAPLPCAFADGLDHGGAHVGKQAQRAASLCHLAYHLAVILHIAAAACVVQVRDILGTACRAERAGGLQAGHHRRMIYGLTRG